MKLSKIKNIFLKLMIGCLIAAAALAVATVLAGTFNDILEKSLFTILIVAIHAIISFSFISNNEKQGTFKNLSFFTNATFSIIVLSFLTAVLGIWSLISGGFVGKLYELYVVFLFAILHGEVLYKSRGEQKLTDKVIYTNFIFMIIVVALLVPPIFTGFDNTLGSFYYRLMAAAAIIDATLTILIVILHRIYLQKHPKEALHATTLLPHALAIGAHGPHKVSAPAHQQHGVLNTVVYILAALMALQLTLGIVFAIVVSLATR